MKVIFLDIDGVLNTYYCKITVAGYSFVDDDKVALLKELVTATGAQIVLTSTWREGWDMQVHPEQYSKISNDDIRLFEALKEKLKEYDMGLLDYTPIFGERGAEIDGWLNAWQGDPIECFVILDDMSGKYLRPYSRYLVQTGMTEGLTQKHVENAIKILTKGK